VNLEEVRVTPIGGPEEQFFKFMMQEHHYLGALPKIGETLWYAATYKKQWIALLSFSAPAWKCTVRDQWIGWNFRHQFDRLKLVTNNSRFLILPKWHFQNLGSRVLALVQKRIVHDWQAKFGHPILLMETFVDPLHFQGTVYKAANWIFLGNTKGYRRTRKGYSPKNQNPKMVFVKPLQRNTQHLLSRAYVQPSHRTGGSKMMLSAQHMQSLPSFFKSVPDPRRTHGRRHRLHTILAIAVGATLCGMHGYQAIADWAQSLGQKARQRFGCRVVNGYFQVPSMSVIRDVLLRVDPISFDQALQSWNKCYGQEDTSLAIDGKAMRNALDEKGRQTHIIGVVGHETKNCYTQKK
jgi:hypothetical protein